MTRTRKPWRPAVEIVDLADRTPPNNLEAEAACLATILSRGADALDEVADLLGSPHWYSDTHRRIFDAAREVHAAGQPVDLQTVAERLRQRDEIQAIGGIRALAALVDATPVVAHLRTHAEIVVDLAVRRRAIDVLKLATYEGHSEPGATLPWLDSVEQRVHDLAPARASRGVVQAHDLMTDAMRRLNDPHIAGTPTGLDDLDAMLAGGMRDGELLVIAARPGMGKTALVAGIAVRVAALGPLYDGAEMVRPRLGAMLFSLEMPSEQMADRMVCHEARVALEAVRKKNPTPRQSDDLADAAKALAALPLWVDDTPAITLMELRAKVRRKQRELSAGVRLGVVIVDYLQLMRGSGEESREQEISAISRGLKQMAKELRVPVIALSQLNRAVETRSTKDKRPQLSDLRESGAIEQDADAILFCYRPEYYIADKASPEARKLAGYAEIIIAKQRNGPTGRVATTFVDHCARFDNRARDAWRSEDE